MANKRKPMKKILDLAKYIERGLNNSEISEILKTDRKTIRRYRKKFEESNSSHEILKNLSEDEAYLRISGSSNTRVDDERISKLNFEHLRKELKKKSVTLQLLWEEYINMHPTGYQYTQFCKHYRDYQKKENYSYTKNYKWGETFLVDYAGQKIPIHDPTDESIGYAHLFVGCLGASNYTYVEATMKETTRDWVDCHINAFEYFDGVPMSVVPDNVKALVTKANAYEPVINEVYKEMADHYDVVVLPTRVRKPKDKAKVEKEVQNAERWIIAKLRNRTFFSLDELNEAIWFLLVDYNSRPFQKRENSRVLEFEQYEKDVLRPLPSTRFEFYEKKTASVYIDYHVEVDKKYYSVPCHLVGEKVEIHIRPMTINIFHKGKHVYAHMRAFSDNRYVTVDEHMPKNHREYTAWNPPRILNWAGNIDESVRLMVEKIFNQYKHPEMGIRSAMGIMSLRKKYSSERIKNACKRALKYNCTTYTKIKSILEKELDLKEDERISETKQRLGKSVNIDHENIRGPEYFE